MEIGQVLTTNTLQHEHNNMLEDLATCYEIENPKKCREIATEHRGMKLIGRGSRRDTYVHPDDPDKVVKFASKTLENKREVRINEEMGGHPFVPVLEYDPNYQWVSMPRVDPLDRDEIPTAVSSVRDDLRERGILCKDTNPGNIGKWNGEYVFFDYGYGCGDR